MYFCYLIFVDYLRRRLASEGIVSLGVCVCVSAALRIVLARQAVAARRISLGGEGNALYPLLSSLLLHFNLACLDVLLLSPGQSVCNSNSTFLHRANTSFLSGREGER